jgi:hypothetical protein
MADQNDDRKGLVIDPLKLFAAPDGETRELDLKEDAWAQSPLPPHDIYAVRCMLAKDGIRYLKADEQYKGSPECYSINIEVRIWNEQDPDVHMYPCFATVKTSFGRGKNISTAAGMVKKLGFKCPEKISDKKLVETLFECLKSEKNIFAEIDWSGSYDPGDKNSRWPVVASTMTDFPRNPDTGLYMSHMKTTKKDGSPVLVNGKLNVVKFISRPEYKEMSESGDLDKARKSFGIPGLNINTAQLAEDEEETVVTKPVQVMAAGVTATGETKKKKKVEEQQTVIVSPEKIALAVVEEE